MSYYDREVTTFLDGTPVFKTEADERSENEIAAIAEGVWRCRIASFGALSPVDWYAERDGRVVGVLELKTRSHESTKYDTVFLNIRKWLALTLAASGMGVPAIFVVRFTEIVKWIGVHEIDASRVRIAGCSRIVKSRNDIEPVIEVPVSLMGLLAE